jgi:hypothetical protein
MFVRRLEDDTTVPSMVDAHLQAARARLGFSNGSADTPPQAEQRRPPCALQNSRATAPRMLTTPHQTTAIAGFSSPTTSDVTAVSDGFARKLLMLSLLRFNVDEAW